jgi:glutaconate CoA-transferase subunit A
LKGFSTLEEAIGQIPDGSSIAIGGALFTRLPMALIHQIKKSPVKNLHYIAWSGNIPLEIFLETPGKVAEISFCFSSLDIFGLAPRFRKAMENNELVAHEYSALTLMNACDAAARNQPYAVFKKPTSDFLKTYETIDDHSGLAKAFALPIDYFIVHAQEADKNGNVLIRGTKGLDNSYIGAAKKIIVSVEKIVDNLTFEQNSTFIPWTRDMSIVHIPMGAYPTSCLPYYVTDYRAIKNYAESDLDEKNLTLNPERERYVRNAAKLSLSQIESFIENFKTEDTQEISIEDKMICYLADLYRPGEILSAGAVSPLAQGSYFLGKMHYKDIVIMTVAGGYVDVAARPLLLSIGESIDFQTSKMHWGGDDTFHLYYEPGFIDYEVVAVAQIDESLRANNFWVTSPSGKRIRLPGQGGMADVSDMHRNFVVYQMNENDLSRVEKVEMVSSQRTLLTEKERLKAGLKPGVSLYVSNLGVSKLNETTRRLERILEFQNYQVDENKLFLLRNKLDPFGLRFLESAKGEARSLIIEKIISIEELLVETYNPNYNPVVA